MSDADKKSSEAPDAAELYVDIGTVVTITSSANPAGQTGVPLTYTTTFTPNCPSLTTFSASGLPPGLSKGEEIRPALVMVAPGRLTRVALPEIRPELRLMVPLLTKAE